MREPRFQVATCEGFPISGGASPRSTSRRTAGISATVCDTLHMWQEIKTYRSEDRGYYPERGGYRGRVQTLRDAETHAAYLNERCGSD